MYPAGEAEHDQTELRCSFAAESRGDPQFATAAPASGYLLVEQPGAWGQQALTESGLDADLGSQLAARAVAASLRVLLVKRHGRAPRTRERRWALADARPGSERIVWRAFEDAAELLDVRLDLDALDGPSTREACYLVCTHGRHDACCALRGRPVVAAFAALRPDAAWECSHVGGDRFAANVVVLPHGLYYGRVGADDAAAIVAAQERSEIAVELARGRSTYRPAVQAAQHFARLELAARAIGDLAPVVEKHADDGTVTVGLAHAGSTVRVTVRHTVGEERGLLTCRATNALHPPSFELLQLVRA